MGVVQVAGRGVEVVGRQTYLEAIQGGNVTGKKILPNSFFNEVLLGKDDRGKFKPIPDEILEVRPLYTGTVGVVGKKGKRLGTSVESQCEYAGSMKTVIVKPDKDHVALVDTMVLCDHGFAPDNSPLLSLSNARTGKPIRNDGEMGEADEVVLSLNGQTRTFTIESRNGGVFEAVGDEKTFTRVSVFATIGLLRRGYYSLNYRLNADLVGRPSYRLGVVREASDISAPLQIVSSQLIALRQADGELIVRGTKEQVDAAARLIEQLRQR